MKIIMKDYRKEIIQHIVERINLGGTVYIYGASVTAQKIKQYLANNGIQTRGGLVVDDIFFQENRKNIISFSKFNQIKTQNDILVCGFSSYQRYRQIVEHGNLHGIPFVFIPFPNSMNTENCYIDREYYEKYKFDFLRTYNRLVDVSSQELFKCFLEAQIGGDLSSLQQMVSERQYFDAGMPDQFDIFIDCGGYTGDTLRAAYKNLRKIGRYYLFEPDPGNLEKIYDSVDALQGRVNVTIIEKGVWSEETCLHFSSADSSSRLDTEGDSTVEVTSIDQTVTAVEGQHVYVKMDIEGSERQALQGAKQLIKKVRPYMAICVYHKRDDLFAIPDLISELSNDGYDYTLKYYGDNFRELVLYCFPR